MEANLRIRTTDVYRTLTSIFSENPSHFLNPIMRRIGAICPSKRIHFDVLIQYDYVHQDVFRKITNKCTGNY